MKLMGTQFSIVVKIPSRFPRRQEVHLRNEAKFGERVRSVLIVIKSRQPIAPRWSPCGETFEFSGT